MKRRLALLDLDPTASFDDAMNMICTSLAHVWCWKPAKHRASRQAGGKKQAMSFEQMAVVYTLKVCSLPAAKV